MRCSYCHNNYSNQSEIAMLLNIKGCMGCGARSWDPESLFPDNRFKRMLTSGSMMYNVYIGAPVFEMGKRDPVYYLEDYAWR